MGMAQPPQNKWRVQGLRMRQFQSHMARRRWGVANWMDNHLQEWINCREMKAPYHLWWRIASSPAPSVGVEAEWREAQRRLAKLLTREQPSPSSQEHLGEGDWTLGKGVFVRNTCLLWYFRLHLWTLDLILWLLDHALVFGILDLCCRLDICGYCDFPLCLMVQLWFSGTGEFKLRGNWGLGWRFTGTFGGSFDVVLCVQ